MKLDINKSYIVYTISDYIVNKQIRILGYINYDRAAQYQSFIENVAINEKFIDNTNKDTLGYLRSQIYYDCCVLKYENNEYKLTDEHIILWDDIIDTERTERLFENHRYEITFKFKNINVSDNINKKQVISVIENALNNAFNTTGTKVDFSIKENNTNSDNVETQLELTKNMLTKATDSIAAFISLEDAAKDITREFIDNDVISKINTVDRTVNEIKNMTNNILASFK